MLNFAIKFQNTSREGVSLKELFVGLLGYMSNGSNGS